MKSLIVAAGLLALSQGARVVRVDKAIPGQYVVIFKEGVDISKHMTTISEAMVFDSPQNELIDEYSIGSFRGYALRCTQSILENIKKSDVVKTIYEDGIASIEAQQNNPPSWGLDRTSQRSLPLDQVYHYPDNSGAGVDQYTLDTGVYIEHNDFGGRATWGNNFVPGSGNNDLNGHGTHCSGTMAGTAYGVAKSSNIIAVKVLGDNGSGAWSGVISGVQWVAQQHNASKKTVGNMSLGGSAYPALDDAVNAAVAQGVNFAVAAGNSNADACNYSPARASSAVCVGATEVTDARAYYSNYGSCVEIFAPGSNIVSTYIGNPNAVATLSGTSMASPHVSGVIALYLGENLVPSIANLQAASTKNVITGLPAGTVNYLLYSDANLIASPPSIPEVRIPK